MFLFKRLSWKLIVTFVLIIIGCTFSIGYYAVFSMQDKVIAASQEKLRSDLKVAKAYLEKQLPGNWEARSGQLFKGDKLVNDLVLIDDVKEMTGDNVTVFLDDVRIATTVRQQNGSRGVGTKAAPEVAATVLKDRRTFLGKAQVVGVDNQTIYEPITDAGGKVIGMMFVGVPNEPYELMISEFKRNLVLFVLVEALLAAGIVYGVARRISRPIEQLAASVGAVADGDLTVAIDVQSEDEVGVLADSVRTMVDHLHRLIQQIGQSSETVTAATLQLTSTAEQSAKAITQVAETICDVAAGAEKQAGAVGSTATVLEQMAAGTQTVSAATEEQTASLEEIATAGRSLEKMAGELQLIVHHFKV